MATDFLGIPMPDDPDTGNGALDLERIALAVEAQLFDLNTRWLDALQVPAAIVATPADVAGAFAATSVSLTNWGVTPVYDNCGINTLSAGPGLNPLVIPTSLAGLWLVGGYCNMTFSGVGTVDDPCVMNVNVFDQLPVTATQIPPRSVVDRSHQSNSTGGEFLNGYRPMLLAHEGVPSRIQMVPTYQQTIDLTVTIKAGALLWALQLSPLACDPGSV